MTGCSVSRPPPRMEPPARPGLPATSAGNENRRLAAADWWKTAGECRLGDVASILSVSFESTDDWEASRSGPFLPRRSRTDNDELCRRMGGDVIGDASSRRTRAFAGAVSMPSSSKRKSRPWRTTGESRSAGLLSAWNARPCDLTRRSSLAFTPAGAQVESARQMRLPRDTSASWRRPDERPTDRLPCEPCDMWPSDAPRLALDSSTLTAGRMRRLDLPPRDSAGRPGSTIAPDSLGPSDKELADAALSSLAASLGALCRTGVVSCEAARCESPPAPPIDIAGRIDDAPSGSSGTSLLQSNDLPRERDPNDASRASGELRGVASRLLRGVPSPSRRASRPTRAADVIIPQECSIRSSHAACAASERASGPSSQITTKTCDGTDVSRSSAVARSTDSTSVSVSPVERRYDSSPSPRPRELTTIMRCPLNDKAGARRR
mmetsp:Transcript_3662/g.13431  ORF Transcript_3662/g.13431 Transcript_3662/m.13431 type:complete len:436 (+) Transcript_3662:3410-4717(+)